jgi:hypothetical protein
MLASLEQADALELMCLACGGDMVRARVMSVNIIGPAIRAKKAEKKQEEHAYFTKPCGHNHACRCSVKLSKSNPFKQEIRAAHGFADEI